jgi:hypothetical protein
MAKKVIFILKNDPPKKGEIDRNRQNGENKCDSVSS